MPTAEDDFEQLLTRLREQLTDIALTVPDLDTEGGERVPRFSLGEAAVKPASSDAATIVAASEPMAAWKTPPNMSVDAAPARLEPAQTLPPAQAAASYFQDAPTASVFIATPPPTAPDVTAPWRKFGVRNAILAASLLIALGIAGLGAYRLSQDGEGAIRIPLDQPASAFMLTADLQEFLISEGNELLTVAHSGEIRRRRFVEGAFAALRWSQGAVWTIDGRSAAITERRGEMRPTVYSLNHVPTSLYLNDRFLWTGERSTRTLRQFMVSRSILGAMLQPIDRIDLPANIDLIAFSFESGGDLYVADARQHRLVRFHTTGGAYRALQSAPLSPILGPDDSHHRFFLEKGNIWALTNPTGGVSEIKRIPFSSLNWAPVE